MYSSSAMITPSRKNRPKLRLWSAFSSKVRVTKPFPPVSADSSRRARAAPEAVRWYDFEPRPFETMPSDAEAAERLLELEAARR